MSMQVHLKEILTRRQSAQVETSIDVQPLFRNRKDVLHWHPLKVNLTAVPQPGLVQISGECQLPVQFACSRCLAPFETTISIPFSELFQPVEEQVESSGLDEDDIHVIHAEKVDLTPYVEEAVVLGMPYVPVCSDTCKGLCPSCGCNRNEQACTCTTERIDPRLAGLKDFFKDSN
jgi:uncharacterized protein